MLTKLRHSLIRLLAGSDSIAINLRINYKGFALYVPSARKALVYRCGINFPTPKATPMPNLTPVLEAIIEDGRHTRLTIHRLERQLALAMAFLNLKLSQETSLMSQALAAAQALTDAVAGETSKINSIITYIQGQPAVIAAAVAEALAQADVDDATAAQLIAAATATANSQIDSVVAAISANTPPTDTGGGDTTSGGGSDTTVGTGSDTTIGTDTTSDTGTGVVG